MAAASQADRALNVVADAFGFSDDERTAFVAHRIARLFAALPFLAGCNQPDRTAAAHLSTYVLSVRGGTDLFAPQPSDDVDLLERLWTVTAFKGGDAAIIDRGLSLLALCMVADYERDVDKDAAAGKHNPVGSGAWDAQAIRTSLGERIESVPSPEMDTILSTADAVRGYWEW